MNMIKKTPKPTTKFSFVRDFLINQYSYNIIGKSIILSKIRFPIENGWPCLKGYTNYNENMGK